MKRQSLAMPEPDAGALAVLRTLREAGHEAYFCGGCVRDAVRGQQPKDWDITTSAPPDAVEELFDQVVPVGKAFGVMVVVRGDAQYEVATFRSDSAASDGRRPESVAFCSAEEDVRRRDFTINGLLYDPDRGEVLDHVGGLDDLAAGRIRAIGEPRERLREDYLRMLRAVRFAARFDFVLETDLRAAITALAGLGRLLSGERLGEEFERMLVQGRADRALTLLQETNLLLQLLPEVAAMQGMPQPPRFHPEGDVFVHTRLMLQALPAGADPRLAWAVLLHDVGKPETVTVRDRIRFDHHPAVGAERARALLHRLRRPGRLVEAVTELIQRHMRISHLREMRTAKQRRFLQDPLFPLHLELHRLDCVASHGKLEIHEWARQARAAEEARPAPAEPLLRGQDLIEMGYRPGPRFGTILEAVEDARLEGELADNAQARAWVRERFAPPAS